MIYIFELHSSEMGNTGVIPELGYITPNGTVPSYYYEEQASKFFFATMAPRLAQSEWRVKMVRLNPYLDRL